MSSVIGQVYEYPLRIGKKESTDVVYRAVITVTTGVVDTSLSTSSDPGFTVTRSGAGTYAVVFPLCPSDVCLMMTPILPPTSSTKAVVMTAFSPTAGTAAFVASATTGGAGADPTTLGIEVHLRLVAAKRAGN